MLLEVIRRVKQWNKKTNRVSSTERYLPCNRNTVIGGSSMPQELHPGKSSALEYISQQGRC
jgi:hypothetical protein